MKRLIIIIVIIVTISTLVPFFLLGYLGFIPGISSLFGSDKPKDLGITYTVQNYQSTHDKFGVSVEEMPATDSVADSLRYSGQKDISISLDSTEITSYVNAEKWKFAPISNLQVKINSDGTAEASGNLILSNILPYISLTTPVDEVKKAIDKYHLSGTPAFYIKGQASVTNNLAQIKVQSLQIGRVTVPSSYIDQNSSAVNSFITERINAVPKLMVRSMSITDGKVKIDATVPEKVTKAIK